MTKRTVFLMLLVLGIAANVAAQPSPPAPKTKLEAFEAQEGVVVIRGFSKVGEMRGIYGGVVTVEAKEFLNATTEKKEYGITIEVKETSRLERENTSFIDYEEIASLVRGLDYITKVDKSATKLDSFQADYRTKGEFVVSTFNSGTEVLMSVASGSIGRTSVFFKASELQKLRELILGAKARLDSIR